MNEKTDRELLALYNEETCPYNKMGIAEKVRDEKLRKRMLDHANLLRHKEETEEW